MTKALHKIIAAGILFGVASALALAFVVYPIFQGVKGDHEKVLAYKQEFLQLEVDKTQAREFETFSRQYAQELAHLQSVFVDSKIPISFFRFLDETATAFNLQMEKAPGPVQRAPGDRWASFEVRLAGTGRYADFVAFLQKIENAPYLLQARTLSLAKRGDPRLSENIEFSLALQVFTK